jgi:NAD(P)-dependent dehydrogenase (short-subunit alcohol dehydrogenase family)
LITGGDSGIGRAVAVVYAKEGADVAIVYLNEHSDAEETRRMVVKEDRRCLLISGDIGDEGFCRQAVVQTIEELGRLDILVNNAAEFGSKVPMKRAGQPEEVANCYVFLASDDSSYISGQVLHPNGGEVVNG